MDIAEEVVLLLHGSSAARCGSTYWLSVLSSRRGVTSSNLPSPMGDLALARSLAMMFSAFGMLSSEMASSSANALRLWLPLDLVSI